MGQVCSTTLSTNQGPHNLASLKLSDLPAPGGPFKYPHLSPRRSDCSLTTDESLLEDETRLVLPILAAITPGPLLLSPLDYLADRWITVPVWSALLCPGYSVCVHLDSIADLTAAILHTAAITSG